MDKCLELALDLAEITLLSQSLATLDQYCDLRKLIAEEDWNMAVFRVAQSTIDDIDAAVKKLSLDQLDSALLKDKVKNVQETLRAPMENRHISEDDRLTKSYAVSISVEGYELARAALAVSIKAISQCTK